MGASALLDEVIAAHGGASLYDSTTEITAHLGCGGWAFPLRFKRGALADMTATASTHEPRTVIEGYPEPGRRGVLEDDLVRIETDAGDVVAERTHPRAAFDRLRRKLWWDDLDLLYFAGYAFWGYMNAPFMFRRAGFEVEETEPWREDGERWRGLRVVFPDDVSAHSREQLYYFGDDGLLRRNDYTAEVFGRWAKAAHYCYDHKSFSGLMIPTRRRAMPRRGSGRPVRRIAVVTIAIHDVTLRARTAPAAPDEATAAGTAPASGSS